MADRNPPASAAASPEVILNCIHDHAILSLGLDGHVQSWNIGAEKLFGFTEAEIVGRDGSCFHTPENIAAELPARGLAEARLAGKYDAQIWQVRKNHEVFRANVTVHPVHDGNSRMTGFVQIVRDITLQHEMEKLREEDYRAQKQEMIGQLAGGVAHDFNNLLTVIEAGQQLVGKYTGDSRIHRVLEVNKVAIDKSRRLISQLLAFSRKQVLKPASTDINDTVSVFDVLIGEALGGNRAVAWKLGHDLPRACIDPAQLQSALLNLVVNARDAMPLSGTLRIFTEARYLSSQNYLAPYNVPEGQYVVLGVSDTGIGMADSVAEHAIEPFFTTRDVGQGAGLGLSQCYGFARQSGGTLVIESVQGVGTTVSILLPALISGEEPERLSGRRTIMLVDDDFAIRSLVGEMLRTLGHIVFEAEDASDALNQLNGNVAIDDLFTDVIMPNGVNGLELLEEARSFRPGLPALLASGYPRDMLRNIAQLQDDVMFLQKPYTIDKPASRIKAAGPYPS